MTDVDKEKKHKKTKRNRQDIKEREINSYPCFLFLPIFPENIQIYKQIVVLFFKKTASSAFDSRQGDLVTSTAQSK